MTKEQIVLIFFLKKQSKNVGRHFGDAVSSIVGELLERECAFSLRFRAIGPLDFDGARRENVLRGAGYAWTPDLWSFLKLQEVGFSPYVYFIPIFKCFSMFRLV